MIRSYRRRLLLFVAIGIVIFIYHFRYETRSLFPLPGLSSNDVSGSSVEHQAPAAPVVSQNAEFAVDSNAPRVRQVTMLYEGDSDHLRSLYLRCITTYKRYGERWGFPTHVLEHGLVGDYSFFNKPAYVLSTMMTELAKPHEERAHWIVWFDGDSVVMNPAIPWTIFLPPDDVDDIHILGTRDSNGFNAGMLIFRVHHWTVNRLSEVLALQDLRPDLSLPFQDQSAMDHIFNRTGNHEHLAYQPRHWWNRYFFTEDGKDVGEFLVHFAGVGSAANTPEEKAVQKQQAMIVYIDVALGPKENSWERDLVSTQYEKETARYWEAFKKARAAITTAGLYPKEGKKSSKAKTAVKNAEAKLRQAIATPELFEMDMVDSWEALTAALEKALEAK